MELGQFLGNMILIKVVFCRFFKAIKFTSKREDDYCAFAALISTIFFVFYFSLVFFFFAISVIYSKVVDVKLIIGGSLFYMTACIVYGGRKVILNREYKKILEVVENSSYNGRKGYIVFAIVVSSFIIPFLCLIYYTLFLQ